MTPTAPQRRPRTLVVVWVVVGVAVLAVVALLASGRTNAPVLPKTAQRPVPLEVECYQADGDLITSWSANAQGATDVPRVDPDAVCTAIIRDADAVAQLDSIASTQRALGHDCVTFDTTDGGHWALTQVVSPDGTYTASGGPAPGRLPPFGIVAQPAPIASLAPLPTATAGCLQLPTVAWRLTVPPLAACTADDVTVSVYERSGTQTEKALCAAKGLVIADRR